MGHVSDAAYLHYQYADSEKLRIRQEAHQKYSEASGHFFSWILDRLEARPGDLVADVGCGPGAYHPLLAEQMVRTVAVDTSFGMVRDVQDQANRQKLPVWVVQASAEQLPFPDDTVDRLMANHMLYHVSDQVAVLKEIRRVVKPGGRVLLATNALESNQRLADLHCEAARSLGYTPLVQRIQEAFSLSDLARVRAVFPEARVEVRPDAFRFPTAGAALRYYASMMIDLIAEETNAAHRPRLLLLMQQKIQSIIDNEGVFRVSKAAGCFVADVTTPTPLQMGR